jgi:hypothetical protein
MTTFCFHRLPLCFHYFLIYNHLPNGQDYSRLPFGLQYLFYTTKISALRNKKPGRLQENPMPQKYISVVKTAACLLLIFLSITCSADIDKTRYITVDEITPGMDAVCLTVYKGIEIEKFSLKVVDVIRDIRPGRDAILVMGTDERFIHTGPVAGCSGSPVYINDRLAGALAFAWHYSKDPLYGVTPIEEMLKADTAYNPAQKTSFVPRLDFSKPIDLKTAYNQTINFKTSRRQTAGDGINMLPCPIAATLPPSCFAGFADILESAGLLPVPVSAGASGRLAEYSDTIMKPGGIIALPFVYGDIELSAVGTITDVVNDKVYAFGHSLLGEGPIDIPMATGYVHTIVANLIASFKFSQSIDIKGALYADQSAAIVGTIGKKAATIPMHLTIERFDDEKVRQYNCQILSHRLFTPLIAGICLSGAATMSGQLPADHSVQYKTTIGIEGYQPVCLENFSSFAALDDCLFDSIGALSLIMNNPYSRPAISSLDFEIKILPQAAVSHIWSFDISNTTVKPGKTITASITLESYLAGHKNYKTSLTIPDNIPPGQYKLMLSGINDYMLFTTKAAPYRYIPENLPGLISIINSVANTKRNNLHMVLILPDGGIAIESAELPQLPLSKTLLLNDQKRSMMTKPATQWLEKIIPVDTIVLDSRSLDIVVEENKITQ